MTSGTESNFAENPAGVCMVCGGTVSVILSDCNDYYLAMPFRVSYGRCDHCGLVQQVPIPRDVYAFYKAYPMHTRRGRFQRIVRKLLRSPAYYCPQRDCNIKLLDYGCGDGGYLESIAGPGRDLHGYEVDATLAQRVTARSGIPVASNREQLIHDHGNTFNIITAHFVFEHLTNLHAGFDNVRKLLCPGGVFYCVVPQFDSKEARLFGRRWHGLDPPRHISFPGPSIMEQLSAQAGLKLREHHPIPFANGFAGSIATYPLGRFSMPVFLLSLPLGSLFARIFPDGARAFIFEKTSTVRA